MTSNMYFILILNMFKSCLTIHFPRVELRREDRRVVIDVDHCDYQCCIRCWDVSSSISNMDLFNKTLWISTQKSAVSNRQNTA